MYIKYNYTENIILLLFSFFILLFYFKRFLGAINNYKIKKTSFFLNSLMENFNLKKKLSFN